MVICDFLIVRLESAKNQQQNNDDLLSVEKCFRHLIEVVVKRMLPSYNPQMLNEFDLECGLIEVFLC